MTAENNATSPLSVSLTHCASYERSQVEEAMRLVLKNSGIIESFSRSSKILVKPNLLRGQVLCCAHAEVVRALCLILQEHGMQVTVRDSSAFGSAHSVSESIGLSAALAPLGLKVQEFQATQPLILPHGYGTWHIGQEAFESDAIISVPKLKAHRQMRVSLGVKNIFGCIAGMRKALAHTSQGRTLEMFCESILALYKALPPVASVLDGVLAMHRTGPMGGDVFDLQCLGASLNAQALDTAIYSMLQLKPESVPLWNYARKAQDAAAFEQNIHYTDMQPSQFDCSAFALPQELMHVSFQPHRLLASFAKRLWTRFF